VTISLIDQADREAIRASLDETLVVEAAAGTGKTTELVARVMSLLKSGKAKLSTLVAVTFTEKAAGEMKLRLRSEIDRARESANESERAHLEHALTELEAAHIGTIHALCAELLRERPIEAKVDPQFLAADETTQDRLYDEAFDGWFGHVLSDPPEGVRRVLRKRSRDRDHGGPRAILRKAGWQLVGQRDFDGKWRREPFAREREMDRLLEQLRRLADVYPRAHERECFLAQNLSHVWRVTNEIDRRELIDLVRDYDGIEEELRKLLRERSWGWSGGPREFAPGVSKAGVLEQRTLAKAALGAFLEKADADLAACLHADLESLVASYTQLKDASGKLDFLDLLVVARNLIVHDRAVRDELQRKYTHILVDEFQDTDPLQAEILLLLAADSADTTDYTRAHVTPGKLFVVGDPKQSIYRFRRADVVLYENIKRRLVEQGARVVHLSTSFRGEPALQRAINSAFAPKMRGTKDGSQAEYVRLQAFRAPVSTQPSLVALPIPRPYSDKSGKVSSWWIDQSVPDAVGAFVAWLTKESGWTVTSRETGARVPLLAKHVCLLFRRFVNYGEDVTRGYVRALEQRRIPHVLVGGKSLYEREEIMALSNCVRAVEWPDDELSVFASLKGPLFSVSDEAMLAYRGKHKSLHPMRHAPSAELTPLTKPVQQALDILGTLHKKRNVRPIADTISELLEITRAHAGIAIWPTGEQALANVMRVLDDARRFEAQGATSFRAFTKRLDDAAERGGAAEAPVVEEGTDGVRIMTVHKAKGLEFPVVILVDPTCPLRQREPSRYVDAEKRLWVGPLAGCTPVELLEQRERVLRHDEEEAVRLLYVAATRARDLLVIPAVGDEPTEGWVSPMHSAIYPDRRDWRTPRAAAGCPDFGDDSVLERPMKTERDRHNSVRPGAHTPELGDHEVVWWDPKILALGAGKEAGLRHAKVLAADDAKGRDLLSEQEHSAWKTEHADALEKGRTPTHRVSTVTAHRALAAPLEEGALVTHESTEIDRASRPHGKPFGILVHAVLAAVPLEATPDVVLAVAEAEGRALSSTAEEIKHAAASAKAALAHPVMRAAALREHRREATISLAMPDGSVTIGVLDLAYRSESSWVIVDYKTDAELEGRIKEYEEQVRTYARAVAAATGEAVRCVLLSV